MASRKLSTEYLSHFWWDTLSRFYGCAHSSTVGFLASQWISTAESGQRAVIDVPPCVHVGRYRRHAYLLLFERGEPLCAVEVETSTTINYAKRIKSLQRYVASPQRFGSGMTGLLVMCGTAEQLQGLDRKLLRGDHHVLLLTVEGTDVPPRADGSTLNKLRRDEGYGWYHGETLRIVVYDAAYDREHLLWRRTAHK